MGHLLADLVEWMTALPVLWAYALILAVSFGENVVPPVPGDMMVVFGGYLVGIGRLDFTLVVVLATIGGTAGFMTMYGIGARVGTALLDPHQLRWLPKTRLLRARKALGRWGFRLVLANRFLSGLRSVISLTVGMAHMPAWKTFGYSTISSGIWTLILAIVGVKVGENWSQVSTYLRNYGWVVGGLIVAFIAVQLVLVMRRRTAAAEMAEEVPSEGVSEGASDGASRGDDMERAAER